MDKLTKEILDKDKSLRRIHNKIDKIEDWNLLPDKPMVTVCMATYNHENYIREALDGVLMQKVNFDYEVIIKEDFSTDKTREIVIEYQKKYPDKIRLWLCKENLYSQKQSPKVRLFARGKYSASCEGDDYWTDSLKLQKQVDFMEENEDYSMVFTNAKVLAEDGIHQSSINLYSHLKSKEYTGVEILKKWSVPTASVLFRNNFYTNIPQDERFIFGDIVLFLWAASRGKVFCINEETVVYRRNLGGVTFSEKVEYTKKINHYLAIKDHFGAEYNKTVNTLLAKVYSGAFISGKLGRQSFDVLKNIARNPKYIPLFLYYIFQISFNVFFNRIKFRD